MANRLSIWVVDWILCIQKLDKKKNYQNNTVVGVDQIYLGKELIYEEDIYITKNKNIAKESILSKIKKWFHD